MTPEERAEINAAIEKLWNTSPAVGGNSTKADWTKFLRARNRLFKKLGDGCRYCGDEHTGFFMLRNDLWSKVVGVELGRRCYGAGWVCLYCVAQRLYPRQLYNSDFGKEGRGGICIADDYLVDDADWTDPETGETYTVCYGIAFPDEGGEPIVKIVTEYYGSPEVEWPEVVDVELFDLLFERIDWLNDYCRCHGLRLLLDGKEEDLTEEPKP